MEIFFIIPILLKIGGLKLINLSRILKDFPLKKVFHPFLDANLEPYGANIFPRGQATQTHLLQRVQKAPNKGQKRDFPEDV